jgi:class 3 adenylate cyclase/CHASE2 domain-containing sensor protein
VSAASSQGRFPRRFAWVFTVLFIIAYWPGVFLRDVRGVFDRMEDGFHDKLFTFDQDHLATGDARIILVALDEETGKKYGFPLPRTVDAQILDKLRADGAKVVAFDMLFADPRPGDAELGAASKRFGKVIHLYNVETRYSSYGKVQLAQRGAYLPPEAIAKSAFALGYPNVDRVLDEDGHVRGTILFDDGVQDPTRSDGPGVSVDAATYSAYTGTSLDAIRKKWGTPIDRKLILNFRVPRTWLRHPIRDRRGQKDAHGEDIKISNEDVAEVDTPFQRISALDIMNGTLTPAQRKSLKGAIVVIGSTSLGYYDHYPTPFTPNAPGAEFHCNVLDNMLHDDFVRDVPRFYFLLAIVAMIWLPLFVQVLSAPAGAAIAFVVLAGWWALSWWGFRNHYYFEFIAPSVALLGSFLGQTIHRMVEENRKRKETEGLFGQYVSPEIVKDLVKNPEKARLGGEKRDMTMLFLDIAHFTTISEKMSPEDLIQFLNKYLSALSQVILDEKGVVGNYIGDCIMAFWNAPVAPAADHRARACLAAIDAQAQMAKLNETLDPSLPEKPAIRIGINSGFVTVGNTGSQKKLQYTTLGDEVNLSSRLEGANKFFGSAIMCSEATYEGAKDAVEARELGRVRVVGKEAPVRVYELLAKKGRLSPEWARALDAYNRGLDSFKKRQYDQAALAFEEVVKLFPKDGPANLYLSTARDYAAIPPEDSWDGVFNLTAK